MQNMTTDPPSVRRIKPTAATQPAVTRPVTDADKKAKVVFQIDPQE